MSKLSLRASEEKLKQRTCGPARSVWIDDSARNIFREGGGETGSAYTREKETVEEARIPDSRHIGAAHLVHEVRVAPAREHSPLRRQTCEHVGVKGAYRLRILVGGTNKKRTYLDADISCASTARIGIGNRAPRTGRNCI